MSFFIFFFGATGATLIFFGYFHFLSSERHLKSD